MPRLLTTLLLPLSLWFFAVPEVRGAPSPAAGTGATNRPNVLLILADDLGYSDLGCYGGEVETPHLDRLAKNGVRYSAFYNSARCCPSRASLVTGLHPHQAGIGSFATRAPRKNSSPAYTGHLLPSCVTLAELLGDAGYSTWMVGKWHMGIPGPIERGFHHYYGYENFLAYAEDQWDPQKYVRLPEGTTPELAPGDDFYATDVFTDYALEFLKQARKKDQPYFLYLSHSSPHFPIQAPSETIDKYVPTFRKGWDVLREERFERQKKLGLVSPYAPLPPLSEVPVDREDIANGFPGTPNPHWDSLDADRREDLARRGGTFAAMVEHVDRGVGRILADLEENGELENTLILFTSDNGACYEWGPFGFDGPSRQGLTVLHKGGDLKKIGQEGTHQSYGSGWANLGNTPLNMYKHFCHEGGITSPLIAHWPRGIARKNAWVHDPAHIMDIVPTALEAVGASYPTERGGHQITPVAGSSLLGSLGGEALPERSLAFEHQGARALRKGDWKIVWGKRQPDEVRWELYNLQEDRSEQINLARTKPALTDELVAEWEAWARKVGADPFASGQPAPSVTAAAHPEHPTPEIRNRPIEITCDVEAAAGQGVIVAQGGKEHGYGLHLTDGRLAFDVRVNGKVTRIQSKERLKGRFTATATLELDTISLAVDGKTVAEAKSPGLIPVQPKDGLSVGFDDRTAAGNYDAPNRFAGRIHAVKVTPRTTPDENATATPRSTIADPIFRWSAEKAHSWYDSVDWPVGANFVPSTAINQLEMWQADTFDPETIDRELGWAAAIGMNTMRVFLHDLAWKQDPAGFLKRVDRYLDIADQHGIRTMFVFFDGVWHPVPKAGKQPAPVPRVHNSGWVQSPGREVLADPKKIEALKPYVQAVVRRYKDDRRVLIWDLFNEPENSNRGKQWGGNAKVTDLEPELKKQRATDLLRKTFTWIREVNPSQPLTAGVWGKPDWLTAPDEIEQLMLAHSDVISFHSYNNAESTRKMVEGLLKHGRPIMCTEYMARGNNSTFEEILPVFYEHKVAAYNWGLVDGKSQTIYPWKSWREKFTAEPDPWHHDVFRKNGAPYAPKETRLILKMTNAPPTQRRTPPPVAGPMPRAEIEAGLKSHDRALFVHNRWIRDPFVVLAPDEYYYLTGTTPNPGDPREKNDPYNIGLNSISLVGWKAHVWRSKDLIAWEDLGTPYSLKDGTWFENQPEAFGKATQKHWRLWAPELHWLGDRWALVHTSPAPVKGANLSLSAGPEVTGPWTNPMGTKIARRHDPSLFKDDDGTWWMVWGATSIAPLKPDFSDFAGKPVVIGPSGDMAKMGHEGCLIMKIHGKYVLFGTGWSTGLGRKGSYNLYYATADTITGPYSERKFAGRFLGHGTPFQDKQGRWWCTGFYNANVPPLERAGIRSRDIGETANTINQRGTTLVPLEVRLLDNGELHIRAKDPAYANPGPDEAQDFKTTAIKTEPARVPAAPSIPGRTPRR